MKTRYMLLPCLLSLSLVSTYPALAQQQEPTKSKADTTVRRTYHIKEVNVNEKKREKKVQKKEIGREVVSDRDINRQFIYICRWTATGRDRDERGLQLLWTHQLSPPTV